jgi:insulysin
MIQTLLSMTILLMTAVNPALPYTVIEDTSNLELRNPALKKRETLKLRLNNGLEVLLISDPGADQSAATVSVGAGSWNDPLEYAGMAHFCEHMLFMGTGKYPSENEFFTYVSNYAGAANAYTAPTRTVYMFSSQTDGFLSILDRFAHFFIDPLFNPANIAREMHAVDQEFAKNIENDSWREYMVFKETGNPNHPNRLFSTGNSKTLGKIPQSALKKWHTENYGAEKMHLVIYSSLPIVTLREAAVQVFGQVPQGKGQKLDVSGSITSDQQRGHITYIKPICNRQSLTLSWELPLEFSLDDTKSADLLAHAIRRGQKYSLYEKLKSEGLIDFISTRVDELGGKEHKFFQISLELTRQGIEEMDKVILRCFEAIAGIRSTGLPSYLFEEKNTMAKLNYEYQERANPFQYIESLGSTIADEDLSSYPKGLLLAETYDSSKVQQLTKLLTPKNCLISILAAPEMTKVFPDKVEQWKNVEYAIRPIPQNWLVAWENAKPNDQIRIADPNPFIPQNLALVPGDSEVPELIANHDLGIAYYVRSPEFAVPESEYYVHILSSEIDATARSNVLVSLYLDHLTDILQPTLAAAKAAGLSCSILPEDASILLQISGYSEKAPLLLQEIVKQMPLNPPTLDQFEIYVDRHKKAYLNAEKALAVAQAKELLDSIIHQNAATKKDKLAALNELTYEEFLDFHKNLFESTYCKALFAGNLTLKNAQSAWLDIIHSLGRSPFPKENHTVTKILQLPDAKGPYFINQSTEAQGNATILLIDEGAFTYEKRAAQETLSAALKEAFFDELRSKQKTGYIARSDGFEVEERLFHMFLVQSNSHGTDDLLFRFEQFIEEFNDSLAERIPESRFNTIKNSVIESLKTRFRSLKDKAALWNQLAFQRDGNFDFVDQRIAGLQSLQYEDFLTLSRSFLTRENRKRIAVLFDGKIAAPFAYQPIGIPELEEIATYTAKAKRSFKTATVKKD